MNISQVGINECMLESACQAGPCFTDVSLDWTQVNHLVDANATSFVGIRLTTRAKCTCLQSAILSHFDGTCDIDQALCRASSDACYLRDRLATFTVNSSTSITQLNYKCAHHPNQDQPTTANSRTFNGNGWIWLNPFHLCTNNYISVQVLFDEPNGVVLYYGPVNQRDVTQDFLLLQLVDGIMNCLIYVVSLIVFAATRSSAAAVQFRLGNWRADDRE